MAKQITHKRLYNIALYYLSRYESTTEKLRAVLERRVMKAEREGLEIPPEAIAWIHEITEEMVRLGYINNQRYAQNAFEKLQNAGKSVRTISQKLKMAGLGDDYLTDIIESQEFSTSELDLNAAYRLVRKKKLGFMRSPEARKELFQKDLAVLGRAGFSYEVARRALKGTED